jgi:ferredoxin
VVLFEYLIELWGSVRDIMAKIKLHEKEVEVPDGESIINACKELGVTFDCESGVCQSCKIEILDGEDNLSDPTDIEQAQGYGGKKRLACQCKIKQGTVNIKF